MKIRTVSDLHLGTKDTFFFKDIDPDETLLLAGDICVYEVTSHLLTNFLKKCCASFRQVVMICGNHEYYSHLMNEVEDVLNVLHKQDGYENFYYLQNSVVEIDNVVIIGATLWTDYNKNDHTFELMIVKEIRDYCCIKHLAGPENNERVNFSTYHAKQLHKESVEFIEKSLKEYKNFDKVIVMTHHAPCEKSVAAKYKSDPTNGAYYSDLSNLILDNKIDIWIHGHMHNNSDYMLGDTQIICNPRGYISDGNYDLFDSSLNLELK